MRTVHDRNSRVGFTAWVKAPEGYITLIVAVILLYFVLSWIIYSGMLFMSWLPVDYVRDDQSYWVSQGWKIAMAHPYAAFITTRSWNYLYIVIVLTIYSLTSLMWFSKDPKQRRIAWITMPFALLISLTTVFGASYKWYEFRLMLLVFAVITMFSLLAGWARVALIRNYGDRKPY